MGIKTLFNYLEKELNIKNIDLELSRKYWKKQEYKKGEYFNEYGNTCKYLGFIISGVFRIYFIDEKLKDNNILFFLDNEFFTGFHSFINKVPCKYYIQSLTNSRIIYIHVDDLEKLYSESNSWNKIGRIITEQTFNKLLYYTESILLFKPEKRYLNFITEYPTLAKLIPQYHIASFLGVKINH